MRATLGTPLLLFPTTIVTQVYAHPVFEALENGVGTMVGGSIGKVTVAYDGGSWAMRLFTRSAYVAGVTLVAVMIPFFGGERGCRLQAAAKRRWDSAWMLAASRAYPARRRRPTAPLDTTCTSPGHCAVPCASHPCRVLTAPTMPTLTRRRARAPPRQQPR